MTQTMIENWHFFTGVGGDIKYNNNFYIKKYGNIIDIIHVYPLSKHTDEERWLVEKANLIDISFLNDEDKVKEVIEEYKVDNWLDLPLLSKAWLYYRYYPYKYDSENIYSDFKKVLKEFGKETKFVRKGKYIFLKSN